MRKLLKAFCIAMGMIMFFSAYIFAQFGLLVESLAPYAAIVGGVMIMCIITYAVYDTLKEKESKTK